MTDTTEPGRVHFAILRVDLLLPGVGSLKGKRALLNKAKAALKNDLECSVSEVGYQDLWQRAGLGIGAVASSAEGVDRIVDRVTAVIERDPRVVVLRTQVELDVLDPDAYDPSHDPGLGFS